MTSKRTQMLILTVFLAAFVIQLAAMYSVRSAMWPNDFQAVLLKIVGIYSIPISAACGGVLALFRPKSDSKAQGFSYVCLALVSIWNCIFIARTLGFCFAKEDSPSDLMGFYDAVSAQSSYLIAGVLTFYFGKTAVTAASTPSASPKVK
jgi:hypothetical protein